MKIRKVRIHRFGGSDVLQVDEVEPPMPGALQVLVSVKAASINPVDFKTRNGQYPLVKQDRLPYTLGRDVSGIVEKCGAQAKQFQVGDEVLGVIGVAGGGFAEKALLDEHALARKPTMLDYTQAAAIPVAGTTAWQGLFRHGQLRRGQSVLIHGGAGGVGHFAIQFAKATGARVLTTVSSDKVDFARSLGADVVIDYKTQRFEDQARNLDLVFDLMDGETRERSWEVLKRGGVLVSTLTEPSQAKAAQYGVRALRYVMEANGSDLAEIVELVKSRKVKPHVHQQFRLEQAAEALNVIEQGKFFGKIVLALDGMAKSALMSCN
jgi:NADPH:quinone reductase-like Zn-dependent oxidoreductase